MPESKGTVKREEIDDKYKWKLEDLFASDKEWEKACKDLEMQCKKLVSYKGQLATNADNLLQFLKACDEAECLFERILVYSNEKMHQDMTVAKYQGYAAVAQNLEAQIMEAEAFLEPEVIAMDEGTVNRFYEEKEDLGNYRLLINRILKKKEHTLSAAEEAILAKASEITSAAQDIFMMFNNADLEFGEITDEAGNLVKLTHGRYIKLMESDDRDVRKNTFQTYYKEYIEHRNMLATTYLSNMKAAKFYADAKKYESTLQMELASSEIPVSVYDNLIEAVHEFLPVMYRYVALRKKVLGVEELHMYDIYAKLAKGYHLQVPYEEAKELVKTALAPMGEEYIAILKEGFEQKWIDVYENEGKRSGAYSWGAYGTHPYVLLNYNDSLNDVFTLAHEMGHAIHTYYSAKNQPYTYANYRIFVAEVASTCNESLLIQHLLKNCEDDLQKIYLLNYFIDQFKGTIFRQTMFAEFEKITHEMYANKEAVTADGLCEVYMKLNQLYFGEGVISDEEIGMEWARIPHFYNQFYVYQYATGFSAAIALSNKILNEGEKAVENYIGFLKGGSSMTPIELLQKAGVDLSSKQPIKEALMLFEDLVKQLEQLL